MGEFADMIIDDMYSHDYDHPGWGWGDGDVYTSWRSYKTKTIKCKYCKSTSVYWAQHDSGKWHLKDSGTNRWHTCEPKEAANKKFKDDNKTVTIQIEIKVKNNNCKECCYYKLDESEWGPHLYYCAIFGENIFNNKRLEKCKKMTKEE